jgi:hypothetical protein
MDREGWPVSPLYDLGLGKVVFRDWDNLWETFLIHSRSGAKVPGFGDWSNMLNDLDPFRDGRAAERMGQYIRWILDGFKEGHDRETVLANAAERYTDIWGHEKVRTNQPMFAKEISH